MSDDTQAHSTDEFEVPERDRRIIRRIARGLLATVLVLAVALGIFAWKVVYRPHFDPVPEKVDALIVLGPLEPWRMEYAEGLMRQGKADNLVLSTPNMPWDALYCDEKHDWPAYCFPPDPSTTRGEAMGLKRLAAQHGWKTFAVVTIDFHAERSRFIFKRCLRVDVPVVGRTVDTPMSFRHYHVAYQLGGFAKEIWKGRCEA